MKSAFEKYNPWTYFLYIIGSVTLAMVLMHPLFLTSGMIILLIVHRISDKGKTLKPFLRGYMVISMIMMILNPLLNHRGETILFYIKDQCITFEALCYGVVMGLSVLLILIIFSLYQYAISSDKLMYLFCKVMPTLTLVLMLALRMVPLLKQRVHEIRKIQTAQGVSIAEGKLWERSKTAMESLNTLVTWSLEEMMQTARSIRSRGYGIKKRRSFYFKYHIEKRDITCMVVQIVMLGSVLVLWTYGAYSMYPKLQLHLWSARTGTIWLIYCIYMSIPLWIEGWESYKWRLYR